MFFNASFLSAKVFGAGEAGEAGDGSRFCFVLLRLLSSGRSGRSTFGLDSKVLEA